MTWSPVETLPLPYPLAGTQIALSFGSTSHGVASGSVGQGRGAVAFCFVTLDGGETWTDCVREGRDGSAIAFPNGPRCWLSSTTSLSVSGETIYRNEGGALWTALSSLPRRINADAVGCEGETVWSAGLQVVSRDPYFVIPGVALSRDGGATWADIEAVRVDVELWMQFASVAARGGSNVWIAGTRFIPGSGGASLPWIIASSDGGAHWQVQRPSGEQGELVAVSFRDTAEGAVAGSFGDATDPASRRAGIVFTRDGGSTWQESSLPPGIAAVTDLQLAPD
jgi:hypothetical protein